MQLLDKLITCKYDGTFTSGATGTIQAIRNTNPSTGYLAVSLNISATADNVTSDPTPLVGLTAADGVVYGAVISVNAATNRCSVVRSGIVPFQKNGNSQVSDLANQPVGIKGDGGNGQVAASGATTEGTGRIVGRGGDSSEVLFVDLDSVSNISVS